MEGLFEFFSSNPIILIILIFIVGRFLFSGNKQASQNKKDEKGKKPTIRSMLEEALNDGNVEKSKQVIEENEPTVRKMTQQQESYVKKQASQGVEDFEQAHEKQLERFKSKYQSSYEEDNVQNARSAVERKSANLKNNTTNDDIQDQVLNLKITKKKLAESIVMAEVLGPPRALNRYKNIAMSRRK